MLKRAATLLLCLVMVFSLSSICLTASARADSTTFTISATAVAEVGEPVYVSVFVTEDSYFTNATMYLHYDPTALEYVEESMEGGYASPSSAMMMAANHADKQYVKAAYVSARSITKGGELILFEFVALKKTPVTLSLSFDECVGVDENDVEFNLTYSCVGFVVNNDGSVTAPSSDSNTTTDATTAATTTATEKKEDIYLVETEDGYDKVVTDENGQIQFDENGVPKTEHIEKEELKDKNPIVLETDSVGKIVLNEDGTFVTKEYKKDSNLLTWVLVGGGAFLVIAAITVAAILLANKAKKKDGNKK